MVVFVETSHSALCRVASVGLVKEGGIKRGAQYVLANASGLSPALGGVRVFTIGLKSGVAAPEIASAPSARVLTNRLKL